VAVVGNRDLDHLELVREQDRAFLSGLPTLAAADDFLLTHGDARLHRALNSADERHGFRRAYAELASAGKHLWLFGHTHHARVWRKTAADAPPQRLDGDCLALDLSDARVRYIVNVGATGRRRAGCGPLCIVLYDGAHGQLQRVTL
jgi:hypothetical protein